MATITKGLKLTGTKDNDTLVGGEKADTLSGLAGDDFLRGNAENDSLNGGDGNDSLDGGLGADKMVGGNGSDYYVVDNAKDVVTETNKNLAIGGDDIIETSLSTYTLPSNVENLILTEMQNSKGFGNTLNNVMVGNSANNELNGNAGNDFLFGQEGDDTLTGGKGDDLLDGGVGNDTAIFSRKMSEYDITLSENNAAQNQLIVKYIGKSNVDGTDTVMNTEFLKFSDKTLDVAEFIEAQKPPVLIIDPPPIITIPVSNVNYEATAPFIYQSNNLQNIDSISALLTYNPAVSNGVDYSTFETEQWRTRASSDELAIDLTQTTKSTSEVTLQGQLEPNPNSEIWYKINLTQAGALQVQDLSKDAASIDVTIFKSAQQNSLTYHYSLYDATQELNSYRNVPAGDYFIRINKGETNSPQALDFKISINTQPTDEFIVPPLNFNASNSTIQAELSSTKNEVFYKFTLDKSTTFTLDATPFVKQFDISLVKPLASGGYEGAGYTFFQSAPNKQIYELLAGTYYLHINSLKPTNNTIKLDIPVISATPINFNTTFENIAPNTLKADVTTAKNAISKDENGNLELTYTFDLSNILGTDDARPNATPFSKTQEDAARLALHSYENIAKLTFRELPAGSHERADLTFTNVSSLGDAAGEASTHNASNGDYTNVTVRINASEQNHTDVITVGEDEYATLLHEIGHALGLKHPRSYGSGGAGSDLPFLTTSKDNNQYTIMSYNEHPYKNEDGDLLYGFTGAMSSKTPLLYDVAAIQQLYGSNQTYNNGDTIYRWDKNIDPFMTIWDSGGIDTIDASNHTQEQAIDLRAGEFSSIGAVTLVYTDNSKELYAPKDNVSIAYNTIIENAIGSNQNDTIIGNSVANQLTGKLGKDNFVFTSKLSDFNVDTITDFNATDDSLTLDRAIFKALNAGNLLTEQELFISSNTTSAENTTQRIIFNTASQSLFYDIDGAGGEGAILFALLPNVATLNAAQIFIQG